MRLTMRTLLNWINHNLSEEDAALVALKVEESELAKALKNQIEEVMQRPRLVAPAVIDGTPLGNANSSAEYLDNAMDSSMTVEYEKFCIHSDVILGEVAACHQILSEVLNQTLEISPEFRTRLCSLHKYVDTDGDYSIPTFLPSPSVEALFDELPIHGDSESTPSKLILESDSPNRMVPSMSLNQDVASLSYSEQLAVPNYWKWTTLGGLALFLLFIVTGLIFPDTIPGRMLAVLWTKP